MPCLSSPLRRPPRPPLFPYTTLFRSIDEHERKGSDAVGDGLRSRAGRPAAARPARAVNTARAVAAVVRSEEHTSELQSPCNLVCRLLLEKKKHTPTEPPAIQTIIAYE